MVERYRLLNEPRQAESICLDVLRIDPANLYRSLRRMVKTGLVMESERRLAAMGDDERRRYYRISELGTRVVAAEAARLSKLAQAAQAKKLIPRSEGAR